MVKLTVITREISPSITKCELTEIAREPISYDRVVEQHDAYVAIFERYVKAGYDLELVKLPALDDHPDCMFMEDVAMLYDTCGIVSRPGADARLHESNLIGRWIEFLRPGHTFALSEPARTDGGDIFPVGRYIFVGQSTRTNDAAFEEIKKITAKYTFIDEEQDGKQLPYECVRLPVKGRLHIKTAGSFLSDSVVLMDTAACDPEAFTSRGIEVLAAPEGEEAASNPLTFVVERRDGTGRKRVVVINAGWPKTRALIEGFAAREAEAGREVEIVETEMDEIAKAEGSLTCLSLLCYQKETTQTRSPRTTAHA